jgi:hypothetical protein
MPSPVAVVESADVNLVDDRVLVPKHIPVEWQTAPPGSRSVPPCKAGQQASLYDVTTAGSCCAPNARSVIQIDSAAPSRIQPSKHRAGLDQQLDNHCARGSRRMWPLKRASDLEELTCIAKSEALILNPSCPVTCPVESSNRSTAERCDESSAIVRQRFAQLYYRTQERTRKEKILLDSGTVKT